MCDKTIKQNSSQFCKQDYRPNCQNDTKSFYQSAGQSANTRQLLAILHAGSAEAFIQNIVDGKRRSEWHHAGHPFTVPAAWLESGNVYYGVHGTTTRITDSDRAKYPGKPDSYIERYVGSKNATIAAVNATYSDHDGKDFTRPTEAEIEAAFATLRSDQSNAGKSDKALANEALNAAKAAKFATDPDHYVALAFAHVTSLTPAPSVVVFTGGGYQCLWLFDQTFHLHTDEDRARAKSLQERWVYYVGGDPGAKDLRRVLRLPGSKNNKKAYAPNFPTVSYVRCDLDIRYSMTELEALLPAPPAPGNTRKTLSVDNNYSDQAHAGTTHATRQTGDSLIAYFNSVVSVRDALLHFGYIQDGAKLRRPGGATGSVVIFGDTNTSYHHSSSDPLYSPESHARSAFDVWCAYQFNGDTAAAVEALASYFYAELRLWPLTHSFEPHIPEELRTRHNRSAGTDRKTFDSITDVLERTRRLGATISKREGAKLAGIGANSWVRSLARLGAFFAVEVTEDHRYYVRLQSDNVVFHARTTSDQLLFLGSNRSGPRVKNDKNTYSPNKNAEPFLTGTSGYMRKEVLKKAQEHGMTFAEARDAFTHAGLGEGVLLAYATYLRVGDFTAQEFADETGQALSKARHPLRKAEALGLAESEREGSRGPKVYSFVPDFWERVAEMAPSLRTHKLSHQRENKRLEQAQLNTESEARFAKLAKKRIPHLKELYPGATPADIERIAYEVYSFKKTAPAVRAARSEARHQHRQAVQAVVDAIGQTLDAGTTKEDVLEVLTVRTLEDGTTYTKAAPGQKTYDEALVKGVMRSRRHMAKATTETGQASLKANIAALKGEGLRWPEIKRHLAYAGFTPGEIQAALAL